MKLEFPLSPHPKQDCASLTSALLSPRQAAPSCILSPYKVLGLTHPSYKLSSDAGSLPVSSAWGHGQVQVQGQGRGANVEVTW